MRNRAIALLCVLAVVGLSTVTTASGRTAPVGARPDDLGRVSPFVSKPARSLPTARPAPSGRLATVPDLLPAQPPAADLEPSAGPVQRSDPAMMPPATTFPGQGYSSVRPPDPTGEAGGSYFVQGINTMSGTSIAVYDKGSGALSVGPFTLRSLWPGTDVCATDAWGDGTVQYDALAGRWVVGQFGIPASPPYYYCVAVSQTPDPGDGWYAYTLQTPDDRFPDYPKLSVWFDGYYLIANDIIDGTTWDGPSVYALDRNAMLEGAAASYLRFDLPSGYSGALAADMEARPQVFSGYETVVAIDPTDDELDVWSVQPDWSNVANSQMTGPMSFPVNPLTPAFCADERHCLGQPGTAQTLDSLARHPMYRLAYRSFGATEMLALTHTVDADTTRTKIRWYVLRRVSGTATWGLADQGTFSPDASNRWTPSVAIDQNGDLGLVYNIDDTTAMYPSVAVAGRLFTDSPGMLGRGEAVTMTGLSSQTTSPGSAHRWGDYNHISVDPGDGCTFWYTAEYMGAASLWATVIGRFRYAQCGSKSPSTVWLGLRGSYGAQGRTLLYHGKNRIGFTVGVPTGAPGQLVWVAFMKYDKATSSWRLWRFSDLYLDLVGSTAKGSVKGKGLGRGRYRVFAQYDGDEDSDGAVTVYRVIRVTK